MIRFILGIEINYYNNSVYSTRSRFRSLNVTTLTRVAGSSISLANMTLCAVMLPFCVSWVTLTEKASLQKLCISPSQQLARLQSRLI